jgi:hypothetical protein
VRPTVGANLARTLGIAIHMYSIRAALALLIALGANAETPTRLTLEDAPRGRLIPVEVYEPVATACSARCPVLLFGTGYRATTSEYSFLLSAIAEAGFLVVGVQHDLEKDPPMPNTGNVIRDRSPYWDRGIGNIEFAIATLRLRFPTHDWSTVILAGHSQGGDIAAKLASRPGFTAHALITLDNRRVPLPTSEQLPVLSIRSSDQPADFDVLPAQVAQGRANTCVFRMPSTRHDDMNNSADEQAKAQMTELALRFLRNESCAGDA